MDCNIHRDCRRNVYHVSFRVVVHVFGLRDVACYAVDDFLAEVRVFVETLDVVFLVSDHLHDVETLVVDDLRCELAGFYCHDFEKRLALVDLHDVENFHVVDERHAFFDESGLVYSIGRQIQN